MVWRLQTSRGRVIECRYLISALGTLNQPLIPDLPGLADYRGQIIHTAEWLPDIDMTGKRVAVIGAGASAIQVVPHAVEQADSVLAVIRTAPHVMPKPRNSTTRRLRSISETIQKSFRSFEKNNTTTGTSPRTPRLSWTRSFCGEPRRSGESTWNLLSVIHGCGKYSPPTLASAAVVPSCPIVSTQPCRSENYRHRRGDTTAHCLRGCLGNRREVRR
ncbi:phenylacetone monooxygenase [Arthrobacter sp. Hiyo8]|nr:phenylacetone monooxygenase [Arthrobacter sp. Hiyo8]